MSKEINSRIKNNPILPEFKAVVLWIHSKVTGLDCPNRKYLVPGDKLPSTPNNWGGILNI